MTGKIDRNSIQDNQMKKLKVSIKTFGCQMNMYETEVAEGFLKEAGFEVVGDNDIPSIGTSLRAVGEAISGHGLLRQPGGFLAMTASNNSPRNDAEPDVILLNTCSVREHAEERVYGRLGMLGKEKKQNPDLIVGLMGCMVEEHREKLFKRFPQLDFMVGTRNIRELPALIDEVAKTRQQVARIKQDGISIEYSDLIQRKSQFHAWLPIMTGCDKVCTYCIVPITRGSEVSMPAREVYREASRLAQEGVQWITLLGQNVNSYRGSTPSPYPSPLEGEMAGIQTSGEGDGASFSGLLEMLCQIKGLER